MGMSRLFVDRFVQKFICLRGVVCQRRNGLGLFCRQRARPHHDRAFVWVGSPRVAPRQNLPYRLSATGQGLVVRHRDFDVLIPSHSRIGKFWGGTRISMLLETPG